MERKVTSEIAYLLGISTSSSVVSVGVVTLCEVSENSKDDCKTTMQSELH